MLDKKDRDIIKKYNKIRKGNKLKKIIFEKYYKIFNPKYYYSFKFSYNTNWNKKLCKIVDKISKEYDIYKIESFLNYYINNENENELIDKLYLMLEMYKKGIKFLPVSNEESLITTCIVKEEGIRLPSIVDFINEG